MSDIALQVENLSKMYRLGEVGTGTISHDLNRWWAKFRGKEDPFTLVGTVNDRTQKAQKGEYVWALKDINFELKKGEVLGIIGKNGAGKSTLLKVISSITSPTKGQIKFNGRIASLLEVGTGMHPELTGRENVFLNGAILGMTKVEIRAKFDDIMDFAGCAKYADTPVKRYSSGMKVRLGFAVAAFLEPEILIVDEVLAVGDAEFQKRAIGKMKEVSQGGGRTVLFVSHNMASIKQLCTKTLVLSQGRVDFNGTTEDAINYYAQSTEALKKQPLDSIERKGNGLLKITDFYIKDLTGKIRENIFSGESVYLCFELYCDIENLEDIDIGFSIHDNFDTKLLVLYSSYQNILFSVKERKKIQLSCKLESFPLKEGNYKIGARVLVGGEEADWPVDGIGVITVEAGDFFKTGKKGFTHGGAPFLINGTWAKEEYHEKARK